MTTPAAETSPPIYARVAGARAKSDINKFQICDTVYSHSMGGD
jgi:hypothetical protein